MIQKTIGFYTTVIRCSQAPPQTAFFSHSGQASLHSTLMQPRITPAVNDLTRFCVNLPTDTSVVGPDVLPYMIPDGKSH